LRRARRIGLHVNPRPQGQACSPIVVTKLRRVKFRILQKRESGGGRRERGLNLNNLDLGLDLDLDLDLGLTLNLEYIS
jgi:hypothetical protein